MCIYIFVSKKFPTVLPFEIINGTKNQDFLLVNFQVKK